MSSGLCLRVKDAVAGKRRDNPTWLHLLQRIRDALSNDMMVVNLEFVLVSVEVRKLCNLGPWRVLKNAGRRLCCVVWPLGIYLDRCGHQLD